MPKRSTTSDGVSSSDLKDLPSTSVPINVNDGETVAHTGKRLFGKIRRPDSGNNNVDILTIFRNYADQFWKRHKV